MWQQTQRERLRGQHDVVGLALLIQAHEYLQGFERNRGQRVDGHADERPVRPARRENGHAGWERAHGGAEGSSIEEATHMSPRHARVGPMVDPRELFALNSPGESTNGWSNT